MASASDDVPDRNSNCGDGSSRIYAVIEALEESGVNGVRFGARSPGDGDTMHSPIRMVHTAGGMLLAAMLLPGCVRGDESKRVFSHEWANEVKRANERIEPTPGIPLTRSERGPRIRMDERGKTRLTIGKDVGVSADVDISTDDAAIDLKFKKRWKTLPEKP